MNIQYSICMTLFSLWLGFSPAHLQPCCAIVHLRAIAQILAIERDNSSFSCIHFLRHFSSSSVITGRYEGRVHKAVL